MHLQAIQVMRDRRAKCGTALALQGSITRITGRNTTIPCDLREYCSEVKPSLLLHPFDRLSPVSLLSQSNCACAFSMKEVGSRRATYYEFAPLDHRERFISLRVAGGGWGGESLGRSHRGPVADLHVRERRFSLGEGLLPGRPHLAFALSNSLAVPPVRSTRVRLATTPIGASHEYQH